MTTTTTKVCGECGEAKPYDFLAKHCSKASGFYGAYCWACYCKKNAQIKTTKRESTIGGAMECKKLGLAFLAAQSKRRDVDWYNAADSARFKAVVKPIMTEALRSLPVWVVARVLGEIIQELVVGEIN